MKNEKMRPYTVMCTDIYLLIMLVVFPLYYADGYFHLPERKAEFYSIATLIYVIVTLLGAVITAFSMREQWSWEALKKNITGTDICMFGFLISNLIALAMSNDVANSWTGKSSRYYGAKVLILVCVSYFLISRYAWINKVFINAFLIGGNGVCLLATFDYFGMDVLGINKQMQPADWLVFISTIGNANTCASFVTMALAGAMVYFCVVEGKKSKILAGVSIVNCSAALITARSDTAFIGVGVVLIILVILAVLKKIELKKYILMLGLIDVGIFILFIFRKMFVSYLLSESYDSGLPKVLNQPILLGSLFAVLISVYIIMFYIGKKEIKIERKLKMTIMSSVAIVSVLVAILLVDKLNIIELFKVGIGVSGIEIAGNRAYTYKRTIGAYAQLPLLHKIFGCGQATITTFLNNYCGDELSIMGISINSAHNHILDYLVITGVLGVVCYLGNFVFSIKHAFLCIKENEYALVCGCIVIAYFAQGIFNIEQTITTTIFWIVLACCEAMYRKNVLKKDVV